MAVVRCCSLSLVLLTLGCFSDPAESEEVGGSSTNGTSGSTIQPTSASSQGTSSSSSMGSGDTSGSTIGPATTLTDGSTTTLEPICGDGNLDDGEVCDDGNRLDSDGCNNDCQESGSVVWAEVLANTPGTNSDTLNAVVVVQDGAIVAGGSRFVGEPKARQSEANLVRLSGDGAVEIDIDLITTERDDSVRGLELDSEGRLYVVGDQDAVDGEQSSGWVAQIDTDGSIVGEIVTSSVGARSGFRAVAVESGVVAIAGFRGDGDGVSTYLVNYSLELGVGTSDDSVGSDPVETVSFLRDVVMDEHGVYVAGYRMDGANLRGFTTTSPVTEVGYAPAEPPQNSYIWGVAIAEPGALSSGLWSVGWTDGIDFPLIARLYQVDRDGDLEDTLPGYLGADSEGAFYTSIVVAPEGDLIVAGGSLIGDIPNQFEPLVRRLDPNGQERWTRVFNEIDSTRGGISALALAEDGSIAVCGNANDAADERRRLVAKLRP